MDNKIIFVKNKLRKHGKKFSLFLIIGILKTVISILLVWLLVDILHMKAFLGSTIMVVSTFLLTYHLYVKARVIKPSFLRYTSATIGFNILTILLISLLVDFIGLSGFVSSTIIICILFIIRYLFFNKIGLMGYD